MSVRGWIIFGLTFVSAFTLRSQSIQHEPKLPVYIESWRYELQAKAVILHLVNNSHKDVTALNISIAERYADGSTDYADGRPNDIHGHQLMEDLLARMINIGMGFVSRSGSGIVMAGPVRVGEDEALQELMREQMRQNMSGDGTFAAGTTRDHLDLVSKDVSDIDAVVDVIAYADRTVQVLDNERAFKQVVAERKGSLRAMEKEVEVIKGVLADSTVTNPFEVVIQKLTDLANATEKVRHGPPEDAEANAAMHLEMSVRSWQAMGTSPPWSRMNITERDWLQQYVEQHEKRIEFMKPHCELVVEK